MTTLVQECPLVLSWESSRAIRDQNKTQMRFLLAPQPVQQGCLTRWGDIELSTSAFEHYAGPRIARHYRHMGRPGDRLWICEEWFDFLLYGREEGDHTLIDEDGVPIVAYRADGELDFENDLTWLSPYSMPRWACGLVLEILEIRVERLQEITEADAIAEGCLGYEEKPKRAGTIGGPDVVRYARLPQVQFQKRWDRTHKLPGECWVDNPWVEVVGFRIAEFRQVEVTP